MPTPKQGYHTKDGTRVPGVTTILGRFKESGALINWAWRQGRDGKNLYETRDAAADVGTYVHALIEAHLYETPVIEERPPVSMTPENIRRAASAFEAFRNWQQGSRLKITPIETPFVSERHRFGGTPDAISMDADGVRSLADWKSSKSFYPDQLLQLAAYRALWDETHPDEPMTGGYHIVRFGKEGGDFEHRWFPLDHPKLVAAWEMFRLHRAAYDLDRVITGKEAA